MTFWEGSSHLRGRVEWRNGRTAPAGWCTWEGLGVMAVGERGGCCNSPDSAVLFDPLAVSCCLWPVTASVDEWLG